MIARHDRLIKSKPMRLLWEAYGELKGTTTRSIQWKCKAPRNMWEAWGHKQDCARSRQLQNKKRNISREVICDRESTCIKECTYVRLFLRVKNLKQSEKKILQWIKKRSGCHRNEYVSIKQECSQKSQKAHRHWISPDTSSQMRQVKTAKRILKLNLNLNN